MNTYNNTERKMSLKRESGLKVNVVLKLIRDMCEVWVSRNVSWRDLERGATNHRVSQKKENFLIR
jgi:hypothetical protein